MKLIDWGPAFGMFIIAFIGSIYAVVRVMRDTIKKDTRAELNVDKIERLEKELIEKEAEILYLKKKLDEKNAAIMRMK